MQHLYKRKCVCSVRDKCIFKLAVRYLSHDGMHYSSRWSRAYIDSIVARRIYMRSRSDGRTTGQLKRFSPAPCQRDDVHTIDVRNVGVQHSDHKRPATWTESALRVKGVPRYIPVNQCVPACIYICDRQVKQGVGDTRIHKDSSWQFSVKDWKLS